VKTRLAVGFGGARAGIWDLILANVNFAQIKKEKGFPFSIFINLLNVCYYCPTGILPGPDMYVGMVSNLYHCFILTVFFELPDRFRIIVVNRVCGISAVIFRIMRKLDIMSFPDKT
jgi:hypothetical protein